MKNPSIRLRLLLGTGVLVAFTLLGANVAIYNAFRRTLYKEVDSQLLLSASLLAKSAELEATSLDYEWKEAMSSSNAPAIGGVFAFWDLASGRITKSPELGDRDLPLIYGKLDQPRIKNVTLSDGRRARVVGLLHYPFTDQEAINIAATMGKTLRTEDYPQVVVCARETESLISRLSELKGHLTRAAIGTLIVIWGAIFAISTWSLRPIREFGAKLLERSEREYPEESVIPETLPSELVGLAQTFNVTLGKVESSREREKEFALHAAHELRTPVAGAYATLEQAILRDRPAADLKIRIHEALNILTGIRVTLESLMRLARLRGGLETSTRALFDPVPVVRELFESVSHLAAQRGQSLHLEISTQIVPIKTDLGLFRAVASNLLENAIRHSPSGDSISVELTTNATDLSFSCTNSVVAAPDMAEIEEWFQPFHRGSDAADDEGGHAGLGLSLSKEAAKILGGRLQAEIVEPTRIRFAIIIPY